MKSNYQLIRDEKVYVDFFSQVKRQGYFLSVGNQEGNSKKEPIYKKKSQQSPTEIKNIRLKVILLGTALCCL